MKTEDILKWGAVAIAGWWLMNKMSQPGGLQNLLGGATVTQPQLPPAGQQVVSPQVTGQPVVSIPAAAAQMAALTNPGQIVNFDNWSYLYQQVTGNAGPSPESVGVQRVDPMPAITIMEWVNSVQGKVDLSGFRGMGRVLTAIQGNGGTVQ